jgi:metal-responsive CopG/Arc/MetJ family transcriptional regulator
MKVMISMPDELLELLDEAARRRDQSRSALIRNAVRAHLAHVALDERREALERLRTSFRGVDASPEALVRDERAR